MGVFEKIFGNSKYSEKQVHGYFKMLNAYTPVFTSFEGGVYEMELTRTAIHAFAVHASKLMPEINGTAYKSLKNVLLYKPNPFMTTAQFLYRTATILSVDNTVFIVPIENEIGCIIGYYPLLPSLCEIIDVGGNAYIRYTFGNGQKAAIEYSKVGILTNFQYKNDFFGESNSALKPTMQLITTQIHGIIEGVKNSATLRFMAKLTNFTKRDDKKKARAEFVEDNFGATNNNGLLLYDNTMTDVKPIDNKPYTVNPAQMKLIQDNVYNYFGVNTNILQNSFNEDEWGAFYEGKVEPFAVWLSLAMTNMTYTPTELSFGNEIIWTANRLQYASNSTKLQVSTQLFDRGMITMNQAMDIWNFAHVPDGDKHYIRKEYTEVEKLGVDNNAAEPQEGVQKPTAAADDT